MARKVPSAADKGGDPSVDDITHQIMTWIGLSIRLSRTPPMTESLGMLNELGLTMPQIVALHVMAFDGAMTMTTLVDRLGLSTSAVSHLLHRLVQMGLCERRDDPLDRRQKRVRLTPAGVDVVARLLKSRVSDTRSSIEPLSDDARRRLGAVLTLIVEELTEKSQAQQQTPSTSAGCPGHASEPRDFEDVLRHLEDYGDDVAAAAADLGDRVSDSAARFGDRIADTAAGLGDDIAVRAADLGESVAKRAADFGERIVKNVNARVARHKKEKS